MAGDGDAEMEKFFLVPEVCPVVSMTSAALSEVYSPVVLARGGGLLWHTPWQWVCPAGGRVRYSASFCPAGLRK